MRTEIQLTAKKERGFLLGGRRTGDRRCSPAPVGELSHAGTAACTPGRRNPSRRVTCLRCHPHRLVHCLISCLGQSQGGDGRKTGILSSRPRSAADPSCTDTPIQTRMNSIFKIMYSAMGAMALVVLSTTMADGFCSYRLTPMVAGTSRRGVLPRSSPPTLSPRRDPRLVWMAGCPGKNRIKEKKAKT